MLEAAGDSLIFRRQVNGAIFDVGRHILAKSGSPKTALYQVALFATWFQSLILFQVEEEILHKKVLTRKSGSSIMYL